MFKVSWHRRYKFNESPAEKLQSGTVWVNMCTEVQPEVPFGGVKQSGLGRENGFEGLECYIEMKSVQVDNTAKKKAWYFP
ncbi:MAG: aldehyde dehydrogenase family protein [Candidatus Bathyarchaeia archaeon]